jgi:hypothetical protein
MRNIEIMKQLGQLRMSPALGTPENYGLRESCRKYANLLCEAKPGRFVRKEAIELLKRAKGVAK